MKKKSKSALFVTFICLLSVILALFIPSLYISPLSINDKPTLVMGFTTTFGGTISFNGQHPDFGFPVALFIAWLLFIINGLLVYFFGSGQKSTFFFSAILFIVSAVLYGFTAQHTIGNALVAKHIAGIEHATLCAQPFVLITLCFFGFVGCLVGIFYKPNRRTSKYR